MVVMVVTVVMVVMVVIVVTVVMVVMVWSGLIWSGLVWSGLSETCLNGWILLGGDARHGQHSTTSESYSLQFHTLQGCSMEKTHNY